MCAILVGIFFFSEANAVFHVSIKGVSERNELTPCIIYNYEVHAYFCFSTTYSNAVVISYWCTYSVLKCVCMYIQVHYS